MSGNHFVRRMWLYFRAGHGQYLVYILNVTSFILIVYRLLIEQIVMFESVFPSLWMFIALFIPVYVPLAVLVGKTHFFKQIKIDHEEINRRNPQLQQILGDLILIKTKLGIKQ